MQLAFIFIFLSIFKQLKWSSFLKKKGFETTTTSLTPKYFSETNKVANAKNTHFHHFLQKNWLQIPEYKCYHNLPNYLKLLEICSPFQVGAMIFCKTPLLAGEWRSSTSTCRCRLLGVEFNPFENLIKPKNDYFPKNCNWPLFYDFCNKFWTLSGNNHFYIILKVFF